MKVRRKQLQKVIMGLLLVVLSIVALPEMQVKASGQNSLTYTVKSQEETGFTDRLIAVPVGELQEVKFQTNGKPVSYRVGDSTVASIRDGKIVGKSTGRTFLYATCNGNVYRCQLAVYDKRITTTETAKTIHYEDVFFVSLKNRKVEESLIFEVEDETVLNVEIISWNGDQAKILLTPKKAGTTLLKIKRENSVEELALPITVEPQIELTAVELYKQCSKAMVEIHMKTADGNESIGSGFFISEDRIVTNYHVIEGAVSITIEDYEGIQYPVKYLYDYEKDFDLAILGVEADHAAIAVSYAPPKIGDRIYTIGSPYGLTGTFSTGIVAKAYRQLDDDGIIYTQITASISRGNSGGPLINRYGEVIGVNTLTRSEGQNLNFAVPITYMLNLNQESPSKIATFFADNQAQVTK